MKRRLEIFNMYSETDRTDKNDIGVFTKNVKEGVLKVRIYLKQEGEERVYKPYINMLKYKPMVEKLSNYTACHECSHCDCRLRDVLNAFYNNGFEYNEFRSIED